MKSGMKELRRALLQKKPKELRLAVAVFITPNGGRRSVYLEVERGDGCGTQNVTDFIKEAGSKLEGRQQLVCEVLSLDFDSIEFAAHHVHFPKEER